MPTSVAGLRKPLFKPLRDPAAGPVFAWTPWWFHLGRHFGCELVSFFGPVAMETGHSSASVDSGLKAMANGTKLKAGRSITPKSQTLPASAPIEVGSRSDDNFLQTGKRLHCNHHPLRRRIVSLR